MRIRDLRPGDLCEQVLTHQLLVFVELVESQDGWPQPWSWQRGPFALFLSPDGRLCVQPFSKHDCDHLLLAAFNMRSVLRMEECV